jgi:hypothetical protein
LTPTYIADEPLIVVNHSLPAERQRRAIQRLVDHREAIDGRNVRRIRHDRVLRVAVRRAVVVVDEVVDDHALGQKRRAAERRRLKPDANAIRERIRFVRKPALLHRFVTRAKVHDHVALAERSLQRLRRARVPRQRRRHSGSHPVYPQVTETTHLEASLCCRSYYAASAALAFWRSQPLKKSRTSWRYR